MPYVVFAEEVLPEDFTALSVTMLVIVGVLHTGIAYILYFGSVGSLSAQTTALFSYVDPAVAIILSGTLLGEGMTLYGALGAVLIIGGAMLGETSE